MITSFCCNDSYVRTQVANHVRGAKFEGFTAGFFTGPFKVVSQNYRTENGETDLILEISGMSGFWREFGGDVLVECKNLSVRAPTHEVGAICEKVSQANIKLAFMVSGNGFTEDALRKLRNRAASTALGLVVPLTGLQIRETISAGTDREAFFKKAIRDTRYLRY